MREAAAVESKQCGGVGPTLTTPRAGRHHTLDILTLAQLFMYYVALDEVDVGDRKESI